MIWPITDNVIGLGFAGSVSLSVSFSGHRKTGFHPGGGQSRAPPSGLRRILIIVGDAVFHSGQPRNAGCRAYWQLSEVI